MAERWGVTAEGCCWARFPPLTLPRLLPHRGDDDDDGDDGDDDGGGGGSGDGFVVGL